MHSRPPPSFGETARKFEANFAGGASAVEAALRADIRLVEDISDVVDGPPHSHGKEHDVWVVSAPEGLRVIKVCRLSQRPYGVVADTPVRYLWRWNRTNHFFSDDARVEGILVSGRFIISQPFLAGEHPPAHELHQWLTVSGWQMYRNTGNIWQSPDGRVILSEAHEGNFLRDANGDIHPIDVALHTMEEWAAECDIVEFTEAYGADYIPTSLEQLLDDVNYNLAQFGFSSLASSSAASRDA